MSNKKRESQMRDKGNESKTLPFDDVLRRLVSTPPKPMKASDKHRPEKAPNAEMERKRS